MIVLSLGFTSCNKNDVTPVYIPLPVIETFNPVMKEFYISENQDFTSYIDDTFVVNSISDLPEDKIFGNDEFLDKDIDFSKYSLIIFYNLQFGKILTIRNGWRYDTNLEQYVVFISYEIEKDSFLLGEKELATYVRGAMLVDHIPAQSFVGQMGGVHWISPK